jgi:mono/diheme cytochrome c family protein
MHRRALQISIATVLAGGALGVAACGSKGIEVSKSNPDDYRGAQLFAARCSGCHTLTAAGTEGSSESVKAKQRNNGPNLDQRKEQADQVLYAIRNGGFSGAIMPQNIVVGSDAEKVAAFVAKYAGKDAKSPPSPKGS